MNELRYIADNFSRVQVESAIIADISHADEYRITAPGDDLSYIKIEQKDNTLQIRRKGLVSLFKARPHVNISMPHLDELILSGASQVKVGGFVSDHPFNIKLNGASYVEINSVSSGDARMEISGASNVSGDIKVSGDIVFNINGASRVELIGSSVGARLELSGASQARLANFNLDNVDAKISGASSAQLKVSGKLDVNLSGASRLEYAGNPTLGNANVSGASSLKPR